jgi:hypothetical protein
VKDKDIRGPGYQQIGKPRDREIARKGDQEVSEFIAKIKTQTPKSLPAVSRAQISKSQPSIRFNRNNFSVKARI